MDSIRTSLFDNMMNPSDQHSYWGTLIWVWIEGFDATAREHIEKSSQKGGLHRIDVNSSRFMAFGYGTKTPTHHPTPLHPTYIMVMKSTLSNQGGWLCGLELTMSPNRILTAILLHSCWDWLSFLAWCVIRGVIIITEASLCGWTDVIIKCKLCPCAVTTFNGWRFSGYYI